MNFPFAIKLSSAFLQDSKPNDTQICCSFHCSCQTGYHFACHKGNNLDNKVAKACNLRYQIGNVQKKKSVSSIGTAVIDNDNGQ